MFESKINLLEPSPRSKAASRTGLLLVGHGTRDARGLDEFRQTAIAIQQRLPDVALEACFLELAEPTVACGLRRLVAQGVVELVVSPLMLFAAGHVKWDIPQAVSATASECGAELKIHFARHLGRDPRVLQLAIARYAAVTEQINGFDPQTTALLFVGRGSKDDAAITEMRQFAAELATHVKAASVAVGFLAMARPSLIDLIAEAAADSHCGNVIVQPHLLFHGELLDQLKQCVKKQSRADPRQNWFVSEHLGPDREIVDTVVENFCGARQVAGSATVR